VQLRCVLADHGQNFLRHPIGSTSVHAAKSGGSSSIGPGQPCSISASVPPSEDADCLWTRPTISDPAAESAGGGIGTRRSPVRGLFSSFGATSCSSRRGGFANRARRRCYGAEDGIENSAVDNLLVGNRGYGLLVLRRPQDRVCGNVVRGSGLGVISAHGFDPTAPCR
jgi:hypothetical protein